MIPPRFVSVRSAFSKFAKIEKEDRRAGQFAAPEAARQLGDLLRGGRLQAFQVNSQGNEKTIPAEFWQSTNDSFLKDILDNREIANVVVREDDLAAILPPESHDANIGPRDAETEEKKKGGRLPKYDWDYIWAGTAVLIHEHGFPPSQEEMIGRVQDWYEKAFGAGSAPSRSVLQPKIKKLYAQKGK